jgi:16S rRNA (adenine1518-N6/adenine1519-N6)-dimethyltransferase
MKHDEEEVLLGRLASKYGIKPSKTYGQNFLIDETVVEKIISLSEIKKTDTVVEIGPGFGVLTRSLVANAGQVISFEIEKKLADYWNGLLLQFTNLKLVWGNALKTFPEVEKDFPENYKVVANLPYQITSAAIRMLLEAKHPPERMTLMVQKEVGERICAKPGDMSLLAVSVQYYADPHFELVVPSSSFWPAPKVDSAVITINKHQTTNDKAEEKWFFTVVKQGFSNRRKLLSKNISGLIDNQKRKELAGIFQKLSLLPTVRAQELSISDWQKLASEIKKLRNN